MTTLGLRTPAEPTRILLVDDTALFRRAIATLIDAQPDLCVVGEAADGLAGVELACALTPDLVVLDVMLRAVGRRVRPSA